ncbi:F-box protein At3g56470, partial [Morus notabilis]
NEENGGEVVSVDWAGLPKGILEIIFERLSLFDCISVSNVCKPWRNVFSRELSCWEGLGFPSLFMSGQKDRDKRLCISMLEKRAWEMEIPEARGKYCWGSYQDWFILVDDVGCADDIKRYSLNISLFNPFTRSTINLPRTWDFYHNMVLSARPSLENCVCMLVHSKYQELAFWVPGAQSWNQYKVVGERPFEDAVFWNGSFYLLSKDNGIVQIDAASVSAALSKDDSVVTFESEIKTEFHEVIMPESENHANDAVLRYLVESCGKILLICRHFSTLLETRNFKVYELDIGQMSWKRVESLGDRILFLGKCSSRSFSAVELGVEMSNCIYFSNDKADPSGNEWHYSHLKGMSACLGFNNSGRKHWGIFRLGNRKNIHFCFRGHRDIFGPIWFTAPLWWYCNNFFING